MSAVVRFGIAIAALSVSGSASAKIAIRSDYPGGNIKVVRIDESANVIELRPDLRNTRGLYFHWDFTLSGAAGRTFRFQFPKGNFAYLPTLGPAVSSDGGATWRWLNADGTRHPSKDSFAYTFGPDEHTTRFAVSIPYTQKNWDAASVRWRGKPGVRFDVLCPSQGGKRQTELLRIASRGKEPQWLFAFAARHHACETTASPVLEGIVDEILSGSPEGDWIRDNADCVFVPFMDKDGVEDGEQGKKRRPHDHNQDYFMGRYTSVRALKELLVRESHGKRIVYFDLHSPHVRSGAKDPEQDSVFMFSSPNPLQNARIDVFRRHWTETSKGGRLVYDGKNDIKVKADRDAAAARAWDFCEPKISTSRRWVGALPNCWASICCEFGYSLCGGVYSQDGGRELGRNLLKAVGRTVEKACAGGVRQRR